jgi:hypothetical protein
LNGVGAQTVAAGATVQLHLLHGVAAALDLVLVDGLYLRRALG